MLLLLVMRPMKRVSLDTCHDIVYTALRHHGLFSSSASAVARNMTAAQRDGAHSHGLFRLAGCSSGRKKRSHSISLYRYCRSLQSGKVSTTADAFPDHHMKGARDGSTRTCGNLSRCGKS